MAEAFGQPLMGWQREFADVFGEVMPSGLPAYREGIVSVMRQSGKTTLTLATELERCILRSRVQKVAYTAQTGSDARKKLLDDQWPLIQQSPLKAAVLKAHRAQGNEAIIFKNGSRIDVLASTVSAGHGKTLDLGVVDEAFDDIDDRREQAMLPAMITRPDAQLLIVSTMGTDASVYLNRKVDMGRSMAAAGERQGICYFEWSIPPDEDLDDPATWWEFMPAMGGTQSEAVIAHARQTMTDGDFRRAFGNQRTKSDERVIPEVTWRLVCRADAVPAGVLVFGVDVSPDREWASVAVCGGSDVARVELLARRAGVEWVVPELARLVREHGGSVVVDKRSPAGSLVPDLVAAGVRRVVELQPSEMTKACAGFYDDVAAGPTKLQVRVTPNFDELDNAVTSAAKQVVGDEWRFARKGHGDISALMAATVALWQATRGSPRRSGVQIY